MRHTLHYTTHYIFHQRSAYNFRGQLRVLVMFGDVLAWRGAALRLGIIVQNLSTSYQVGITRVSGLKM